MRGGIEAGRLGAQAGLNVNVAVKAGESSPAGADFHSGRNDDVIDHPEVSAIIVSAPEQQHTAPILRGLELGKPVLVEKPIGFSLTEATGSSPACGRRRAISVSATAGATKNV